MHKARHRALVLLSHGVYTSSQGSALRTYGVLFFMCAYVFYFQVRGEGGGAAAAASRLAWRRRGLH